MWFKKKKVEIQERSQSSDKSEVNVVEENKVPLLSKLVKNCA